RPAVGPDDDLVDLLLGLAQLFFAVLLQGGPAFVGLDRVVELGVALLQRLHQRLQLGERLLEAHLLDCQWLLGLGHDAILRGGCPVCAVWLARAAIRRPSAAGHGRRRWPPVLPSRTRPRAPRQPVPCNADRRSPAARRSPRRSRPRRAADWPTDRPYARRT